MAPAASTSSPRDHAADANPDLARKKQRLGEDPGASPGDSVIIEADEPEDVGSSMDNAIEIEDDLGLIMEPYSQDFIITTSPSSPLEQIRNLQNEVQQNWYINPDTFIRLSKVIADHIERTSHECSEWRKRYLDDEPDFFTNLATLAWHLLGAGDLFEPQVETDSPVMRQAFHGLVKGLEALCRRIVPLLPDAIKTRFSRRDSATTPTRQQSLGALYFIMVAVRILSPDSQTMMYFHNSDRRLKLDQLITHIRASFFDDRVVSSLAAIIQTLSGSMREIKDSWLILHNTLLLLNITTKERSSPIYHLCGEVEAVMEVINACILPAICEKHPRALPDTFHESLTSFGAAFLMMHVQSHDQASAAHIYEHFVKSASDALIPEANDNGSLLTSLWRICGAKQDVLAQLLANSWSMQTAKAFICSDIMDIRNVGLSSLGSQLVHLFNQGRVATEGFEHPAIQYAVRFLRKNEITGYIFGPESRAGLVSQSSDVVCFLAATYTYTNAETDIIWRACSTSVEADFVKASFQVLRKLITFLDFGHLIYIAKCYSYTPVARLGTHAVDFLPPLLRELEKKSSSLTERTERLAMAYTSIDILKHANSTEPSPSREQLRQISMVEISRFAKPPFEPDDRMGIYSYCIPDIEKKTCDATTAVEVLSIMLQFPVSSLEADHIQSMLPTSAAVDELCNFVRTKKGQASVHADVVEATTRLSCIVRLMALSPTAPDTSTQESLFTYAFGDSALSNESRNAAWEELNSMASTKGPQSAARSLWQGYMQDHVPFFSANLATPKLIEFILASLKDECLKDELKTDMTQLLSLPLWKALVRVATSSPDDSVVHAAVGAVIDLLFLHPIVMPASPATVVQCHSEFVRDHIESLRHLYESFVLSRQPTELRDFHLNMNLLAALLEHSRESLSTYALAREPDLLILGDLKEAIGRISFTAQVYGPELQPNAITVHATEETKVLEVLAKLPGYTGAAQHRAIAGGVEISHVPEKTLSEAGVQESGVILIRPKYAFDLDLCKVLTNPGPVEHAILARYSTLEAFVDGPEEIAHSALSFLQNVRLPAQPRSQVASAPSTAQDLFPSDRRSRTMFSLFVLRTHLSDFARLGVVDRGFILRAARLLTEFVLDCARASDALLMLDVLKTLLVVLQERPIEIEPLQYFEDPTRFTCRLVQLLFEAKNMPKDISFVSPRKSLRNELAVTTYQILLLGCQTSEALWNAFTSDESVVVLHAQLIVDDDVDFSARMTQPIRDLCQETSVSQDVPKFYWRVLFPTLSEALAKGAMSESYFNLAVEVLHHDHDMQNDETAIRGLLDRLTSELWAYKHMESPPLLVTDKALAGLLRLFWAATIILKSMKKPLQLHGLPKNLFCQLLFPQPDDHRYSALVKDETRGLVYDLIRSSFEPGADYEDLVNVACEAAHTSVRDPTARFPGLSEWIRPPSICAGLTNLGMTCYMNSLLQQLFANLQFRKFVLDQRVQDPQRQNILTKVQTLFVQMQNGVNPIAEPASLAAALNVQVGVQEDVHTFYTTLLSRLEENMPDKESQRALTWFFTGKSITQIRGDCGHVSSRLEPFTELSITVKNKASLQDSLDEFVQGEPLEGANKYMCVSCAHHDGGRLVNALKRTCLDAVPDSLTFCLKRFAFDNIHEGENKVNDRFDFPAEIDMSVYERSYLENPENHREPDMFELVGVIVHQGSLSYGHYWSYVRVPGSSNPYTSVWMYLEDAKFIRCSGGIQEVQKQCCGGLRWADGSERPESAYVLFYQRKGYISQADQINSMPKHIQIEHMVLPMVDVQESLTNDTNRDNLWRLNIASLFSDQFGAFVTWLLGQLPCVLETRPSSPEADEAIGQTMSTNDSACSNLKAKIGDLIVSYTLRILLANPQNEDKLAPLMSSLATMLKARPTIALHILRYLCQDRFGFEAIVRQKNPKVRAQLFKFVESCMSYFRQQQPNNYDEVMVMVIGAHASLLPATLDLVPGQWTEYLAFAANFARLGFLETGIILENRYLEWVYDVLYLRWDQEARKRHAQLWNWMRNSTLDHSPLFEFLYNVLRGHIDLSEPYEQLATAGENRTQTLSGWCLRKIEVEHLLQQRPHNPRPLWTLFLSAVRNCPNIDMVWRNYCPGKLLGLLVGYNTHPDLFRAIEENMAIHYDYEEHELRPLLYMTLHFCLSRSDQECRGLLKALSKNLVLWETSERRSLWFLGEAHKLVPMAVVESVPVWAKDLLLAKGPQARQAAASWLQDHLFGPSPISDDSALDASRIRATRIFAGQCKPTLHKAYSIEESRGRYDSMIKSLEHAKDYLETVQVEILKREQSEDDDNVVLGPEIVVEYGESRGVLVSLQELLDDLSSWEPQTALPTRTVGAQKSFDEDSEDLETSDAEVDEMSEHGV